MLTCAVSCFGDLVCPHCHCHIITPPYMLVVAGWGRCPRCHDRFAVGPEQAKEANVRNAALSAGRTG
jgi:hypothetical protein